MKVLTTDELRAIARQIDDMDADYSGLDWLAVVATGYNTGRAPLPKDPEAREEQQSNAAYALRDEAQESRWELAGAKYESGIGTWKGIFVFAAGIAFGALVGYVATAMLGLAS